MTSPGKAPERKPQASFPASSAKFFFGVVRLAVGVAIVLYLGKSGIIDWRALSRLFTQWPFTIAAVVLLLVDAGLMSARLCWLLRPPGLIISWYNAMKLTLVGFLFSTFLPGAAGGDVARIFYAAKGNSGRRTEIITVLLLDRAIGLFALLVLPLLFVAVFPELVHAMPAIRILLITATLFAAGMPGTFLIFVLMPRYVNRLLRGATAEQIVRALAGYRGNLPTVLAAVAISLAAHLSLIAVTVLGVLAINPNGWPNGWTTKMFFVIPLGHLANSLPITPGGLGVGEAAFNALFEIAGLRGGAEALLCFRIWKAMVGLLGLAIYVRGLKLGISEIPRDA